MWFFVNHVIDVFTDAVCNYLFFWIPLAVVFVILRWLFGKHNEHPPTH
jgi:hypothetical protein